MTRKFKTVDYEAALDQTVSLREALPANHLARFVVELVAQLDLSGIYERYGSRGGEAYAPAVCASNNICTNRALISFRKVLRKCASVSWSGCNPPATNRKGNVS